MEHECLICFEPITIKDKTATCAGCMTVLHAKCYTEWYHKKNTNCIQCIYCQEINTMVYYAPPTAFQKFCNKIYKFFK